MKKITKVFIGLLAMTLLILLTSCADSVNCVDSVTQVGFFYGFWHGAIAGIAWIVSLFSDNVAVYAIYNNGGWYDFGFLLGVGGFSSGAVYSNNKK